MATVETTVGFSTQKVGALVLGPLLRATPCSVRYHAWVCRVVLILICFCVHMRCQQEPRFALSGASNICSAALPETSRTALSFAPVYMFLSLRKAMPVTCSHLHVQRTDCSILRPFAAEMNATVDSRSLQSRQTSLMVKQRLSTDKTCFILSLVDAWVVIAARSHRRCSAACTHHRECAIGSP